MEADQIKSRIADIVLMKSAVDQRIAMEKLKEESGLPLKTIEREFTAMHRVQLDAAGLREPVSHAEAAAVMLDHLPSPLYYDEGKFWLADEASKLWTEYSRVLVEQAVDDTFGPRGYDLVKRNSDTVAVTDNIARLVGSPGFFNAAPTGVAIGDLFFRVGPTGVLRDVLDVMKHLARHKLLYKVEKGEPKAWLGVLERHLETPEQIARLQECMGLTILGALNRQKRAVMMIGEGDTSKSLVLQVLESIMPPGSTCSVPLHLLDDPRHIVDLRGKLLNYAGELDPNKLASDAVFKAITGGDPVTGRAVYEKAVTFTSRAACWFASNELVSVRDRSDAFYDRFLMLHFRNPVEPDQVDRDYFRKVIQPETGRIVGWMIEGAKRALMQGITDTGVVEARLKGQWRRQNDSIRAWFEEGTYAITGDLADKVAGKEVYHSYRNETLEAGMHPVGRNKFYDALDASFWRRKKVMVSRSKTHAPKILGLRSRNTLVSGGVVRGGVTWLGNADLDA